MGFQYVKIGLYNMGKKVFFQGLAIGLFFFISLSCLNKSVNLGERWQVLSQSPPQEQSVLWLEDFELLVRRLEKSHPGLWADQSPEQWQQGVEYYRQGLAGWDNLRRYGELLTLIAGITDGHTQVIPSFTQHRIPMDFQAFKEGVFVVSVWEGQEEYLGWQLMMIGSTPLDEAMELMEPHISATNQVERRNRLLHAMSNGEMLYLAGLTDDPQQAVFTFLTPNETLETLLIQAHPEDDSQRRIGIPTAYDRVQDRAYSLEYHQDLSLVVLHYNQCWQEETYSVNDMLDDLRSYEDKASFLVVDLRWNRGGDSRVFRPILRYLTGSPFNRRGHIFTAIGRETYGSAINNAVELNQGSSSIYIGENSGGKPNYFGDPQSLVLPNSGLTLHYSTQFFHYQDREIPWISPQIPLQYSFQDYQEGRDPLIELFRNQLLEEE